MSLFQLGDFTLNSGEKSVFKIDCDALTGHDLIALALMASKVLGPFRRFGKVVSVPKGGDQLAALMEGYVTAGHPATLIVDDVLTTGGSMNRAREKLNDQGVGVFGLVIFARGHCPSWVEPLFQMDGLTPS